MLLQYIFALEQCVRILFALIMIIQPFLFPILITIYFMKIKPSCMKVQYVYKITL